MPPAEATGGYEYQLKDGTVVRAATPKDVFRRCPILGAIALTNPEMAQTMLDVAATHIQDHPEPKQEQKDTPKSSAAEQWFSIPDKPAKPAKTNSKKEAETSSPANKPAEAPQVTTSAQKPATTISAEQQNIVTEKLPVDDTEPVLVEPGKQNVKSSEYTIPAKQSQDTSVDRDQKTQTEVHIDVDKPNIETDTAPAAEVHTEAVKPENETITAPAPASTELKFTETESVAPVDTEAPDTHTSSPVHLQDDVHKLMVRKTPVITKPGPPIKMPDLSDESHASTSKSSPELPSVEATVHAAKSAKPKVSVNLVKSSNPKKIHTKITPSPAAPSIDTAESGLSGSEPIAADGAVAPSISPAESSLPGSEPAAADRPSPQTDSQRIIERDNATATVNRDARTAAVGLGQFMRKISAAITGDKVQEPLQPVAETAIIPTEEIPPQPQAMASIPAEEISVQAQESAWDSMATYPIDRVYEPAIVFNPDMPKLTDKSGREDADSDKSELEDEDSDKSGRYDVSAEGIGDIQESDVIETYLQLATLPETVTSQPTVPLGEYRPQQAAEAVVKKSVHQPDMQPKHPMMSEPETILYPLVQSGKGRSEAVKEPSLKQVLDKGTNELPLERSLLLLVRTLRVDLGQADKPANQDIKGLRRALNYLDQTLPMQRRGQSKPAGTALTYETVRAMHYLLGALHYDRPGDVLAFFIKRHGQAMLLDVMTTICRQYRADMRHEYRIVPKAGVVGRASAGIDNRIRIGKKVFQMISRFMTTSGHQQFMRHGPVSHA